MKKHLSALCFIALAALPVHAQDFGLSFSYFLPKDGYFSTPISPFSIRGLGFNINRYLAIETGASLYRMSGLNVKDLPFESRKPLVGPNFTIFVPAEVVIQLQGSRVGLDIKGGGFFFYGFAQKVNYGNFDRALRSALGWQVANSDLLFDNHPGFGYHGGAELTIHVTNQVGVSIETNYLVGDAKFPMQGSVTGGTDSIDTIPVEYNDAKIDFTGLEFSIGLIFSAGNSRPARPRRRR